MGDGDLEKLKRLNVQMQRSFAVNAVADAGRQRQSSERASQGNDRDVRDPMNGVGCTTSPLFGAGTEGCIEGIDHPGEIERLGSQRLQKNGNRTLEKAMGSAI
jgi:hypothetical protein